MSCISLLTKALEPHTTRSCGVVAVRVESTVAVRFTTCTAIADRRRLRCRAAVKSAPSPAAAAAVLSNLGALLLSSGRLQDSLKVIDDCVQLSKQAGYVKTPFYAGGALLQHFEMHACRKTCRLAMSPALAVQLATAEPAQLCYDMRSGLCTGSIFNKGKALGMLGNAEEAAATYQLAIEAARGVSAGTFTKAYASLKKFTQEQVADMESALRYLQLIEGQYKSMQPGIFAGQMCTGLIRSSWSY